MGKSKVQGVCMCACACACVCPRTRHFMERCYLEGEPYDRWPDLLEEQLLCDEELQCMSMLTVTLYLLLCRCVFTFDILYSSNTQYSQGGHLCVCHMLRKILAFQINSHNYMYCGFFGGCKGEIWPRGRRFPLNFTVEFQASQ